MVYKTLFYANTFYAQRFNLKYSRNLVPSELINGSKMLDITETLLFPGFYVHKTSNLDRVAKNIHNPIILIGPFVVRVITESLKGLFRNARDCYSQQRHYYQEKNYSRRQNANGNNEISCHVPIILVVVQDNIILSWWLPS